MNHLTGQMVRYLFVGGIVVAVNISVLYSLTEFAHVYYIVSAVLAFGVSFVVSFVLQKRWTFRDQSAHRPGQVAGYLSLQLGNVAANTLLLYLIVEYLHVWYIAAQLAVSLFLAIVTFFIARWYIFTGKDTAGTQNVPAEKGQTA